MTATATTTTTTSTPPRSTAEAEQRFFARYAEAIGGRSWPAVERWLGHRMHYPRSVEAWIALAEEVRDRLEAAKPGPAAPKPTPVAPALAPAAEEPAPVVEEPAPRLAFSFSVRVRIGEAEGPLTISADRLSDLVATVKQLGQVRAVQLVPEARPWQTTPDGRPICPKHGVPMRLREKQGDQWWSHNMGSEADPCYCKGYQGHDSPGWDR